MNMVFPNNMPEKHTVVASRFTACNSGLVLRPGRPVFAYGKLQASDPSVAVHPEAGRRRLLGNRATAQHSKRWNASALISAQRNAHPWVQKIGIITNEL